MLTIVELTRSVAKSSVLCTSLLCFRDPRLEAHSADVTESPRWARHFLGGRAAERRQFALSSGSGGPGRQSRPGPGLQDGGMGGTDLGAWRAHRAPDPVLGLVGGCSRGKAHLG